MATRRWNGRAVPVAQVDTITVADTWATADTATITINGKDLVLTVGTDATTAQVATAIKEMINGDSQTGTGDHTFSTTGNLLGEFSRLTATVANSVVTVTADDKGKPFTMTATETTAGDGTATQATATSATGPNHWSDADNWSGDTVPVDGDTVVFDFGDVGCLYGLSTGIQPAALIITQGYTGTLGLPDTNEDDTTYPYDEYRTKYLTFGNDAGTGATAVTIGEGEGQGSGRLKLDFADCTVVTINVRNSGQRADADEGTPSILIVNTDSAQILNLQKGDVGVAYFDGEAAHLATLRVGYLENQEGDSQLVCGDGCDLTDADIDITGGVVSIDSTTSGGTIALNGGELTALSGAHAAITIDAGTVYYRSTGTITTLLVGGGGGFDCRRDNRGRTITNISLYENSSFFDPQKTVTATNGFDLVRASIPTLTAFDVGTNLTLTPSAI